MGTRVFVNELSKQSNATVAAFAIAAGSEQQVSSAVFVGIITDRLVQVVRFPCDEKIVLALTLEKNAGPNGRPNFEFLVPIFFLAKQKI